ncbi:MAG: hypothetical protein J6V76_00375 [Bacteroidales bacterium]|nr:hypothetical protein [Bacteroidales bacterium]
MTDIFFDAATGISYNDLLNFEKTDNIRRAIVQGLFNIVKNLTARKIKQKHLKTKGKDNDKITIDLDNFWMGLTYQLSADLFEKALEKL